MKSLVTIAFGAGLAVLPCTVMAETHVFSRSGPWAAFDGTDNAGDHVCGISTAWDDGQYFGIKRYEGDNFITVQAIRPRWSLDGGDVAIVFRMDDNPFWTSTGTTTDGGDKVEFRVPLSEIGPFVGQLVRSSRFILSMGNNHITWTIDLSGTSDVVKGFTQCVAVMPR